MGWKQVFENLVGRVERACAEVYGDRLVSLAVFGSVARGTMGPESDLDLLVVAEPLPRGRMARVREFERVDALCEPALREAEAQGVRTTLSPVIKTPSEVELGSPLFLDMTIEVRILRDREGFLERYLRGLAERLDRLGARRIRMGGGYYWLLKPDLKPGEEVRL